VATRSGTGPVWVIGWREWLALPDLKIPEIKVKIDTGARSSALHAFDVERFRRNGKSMVRFRIHPYQRDPRHVAVAEVELAGLRTVRDSGGHAERRPVIITKAKLRNRSWAIELTLTNRDAMGFRMLVGRSALRQRFLVDPGKSFLAGRPASWEGPRSGGERS